MPESDYSTDAALFGSKTGKKRASTIRFEFISVSTPLCLLFYPILVSLSLLMQQDWASYTTNRISTCFLEPQARALGAWSWPQWEGVWGCPSHKKKSSTKPWPPAPLTPDPAQLQQWYEYSHTSFSKSAVVTLGACFFPFSPYSA